MARYVNQLQPPVTEQMAQMSPAASNLDESVKAFDKKEKANKIVPPSRKQLEPSSPAAWPGKKTSTGCTAVVRATCQG